MRSPVGRLSHEQRRADSVIIPIWHRNRPDLTRRVSIGAAPERRPDRINHEDAGDRPAGSRSYDAEPAGVWIACLQTAAGWNG